ncbi:SDR family oxidoreductase [Phytohabitans sp. ZYX-F-186]|uniref:SDR family oxidoreductase n=1 Tax=Phytohabitans maris TaxID=3071409 RepID=A0ABU0ZK74_9ACTN|nr:SDR family oxidoreductase [Phytohabitans sp. ZYX-F-186]MDQ7907453.1 SDR family oxidoreductase [Phytohabitans sp. ZYX-F-186]
MTMRMIVTGAAGGIGRAVATLAAQRHEGCSLALVDRDKGVLDEVADRVGALGARAVAIAADLATVDGPADAVRAAEQAFGGVDALVSNAGIGGLAALKDIAAEDWDRVFAVNARATLLLAQAAYGSLAAVGGSIVATTSVSARFPTPPMGAYSPAKAALLMLVKQLALEWGPAGIRVNCVAPGPTDTPLTFTAFGDQENPKAVANRAFRESQIPLRKIGRPEDIARAVLFLAGPDASHVTGTEITVDGGLSLALMPATGTGKTPRHSAD